jgi:hypothetical protein
MKSRGRLGTTRNEADDRLGRGTKTRPQERSQDSSLIPQTSTPKSPTLYKVHLTRVEDVRRVLSANVNAVRRGELTAAQANAISYCCNVLLKCFDLDEFSKQLRELERRVYGDQDVTIIDLNEEEEKELRRQDDEFVKYGQ